MMGFFDIIQAYFTQITGRFMMFSGRDVSLLYGWRQQGVSAASVCRGIRDAVRTFDRDDPPRSVYNCRKFIEPYIKRARSRVLADAPQASEAQGSGGRVGMRERDDDNVALQALRVLERAGSACEDMERRALYRRVWYEIRSLVDLHTIDEQYAGLLHAEERLSDGAFELLTEDEQESLREKVLEEARSMNMRMSEDEWGRHAIARRRHLMVREHDVVSLLP